jgi:hypothetical protein
MPRTIPGIPVTYKSQAFGQLMNLCHDLFQQSHVTVNDADVQDRPLPFVLKDHLGKGGIET